MKEVLFEKAAHIDGITIPVECAEMTKSCENPDYFAQGLIRCTEVLNERT